MSFLVEKFTQLLDENPELAELLLDENSELAELMEKAHLDYVEALRGNIPKDWTYHCRWASNKAFAEFKEILGEDIEVVVENTLIDGLNHFTAFISPKGIEKLRDFLETKKIDDDETKQ